MAIFNPCCCITLRTGAKTVATIDVIVALILLLVFLTDLSWTISQNGVSSVSGSYIASGVWTILTVFLATNVGISALLYTGARNYSIKRCKWWFYIQTVITSIAVLVLILIICFQISFGLLVLDLIHLLYRIYTLWVVYLFIGELTYLDTLCSLSSHKKGGAMMYAPHPPAVPPPPTIYSSSFYQQHSPYPDYSHEDYHHQPYEDHGNTTSVGITGHPTWSSDDGLPGNGTGASGQRGGIDNPTYLP